MNEKETETYNEWLNGLTLEQKAMHSLLETFMEDCGSCEWEGAEKMMMTTNEIIDRLFDMGKLEMQFVNVYMRMNGYRTVKCDGRVQWLMYQQDSNYP